MPFGMQGNIHMVVMNEKVYIGGGVALSPTDEHTVMVYDPKCDNFTTLLQSPQRFFSMTVIDNQLVLVGGRDAETNKRTNKLAVWNKQSANKWSHPFPSMSTACTSPAVITHHNKWLVVAGGRGAGGNELSRVEIHVISTGQWYFGTPLPQPRSEIIATTLGNVCYVLGGFSKGDSSKKVFSVYVDSLISRAIHKPASASVPSPWQTLTDTPQTCSTPSVFKGSLLAVGGGQLRKSSAICLYQPSSSSWIKAGELPTRRSGCACTILPNGEVFVAGGSGTEQRMDTAIIL